MGVRIKMKLLITAFALILTQAFSIELQSPDIEVIRKNDDLEISWSPVQEIDGEECFALYKFTYKADEDVVVDTILDRTSTTVPFIPCTEKTFIVSPRCRTGATVAESSHKTYTTTIHECEPLNMRVETTPLSTARLTWDSNSCALAYNMTQIVNGNALAPRIIPSPISSMELQWFYCTQNTIVMTIVPRAGFSSVAETIEFHTRLHESMTVENLRINHVDDTIEASWSRPSEAGSCEVDFLVSIEVNGDIIYESKTSEKSYNFDHIELPPCSTASLTVTPFDEEGFGEPKTTSFVTSRGNAGAIQNLSVNNGRIDWIESQDNGECDVVYTVLIREETGDESSHTTRDAFFDNAFVTCAMYNIIVISRIGEDTVSTLLANHRSRPTEVRNVDDIALTEEGLDLKVTWSPVVIGVCEVRYSVRHYIDDVLVYSVLTTETAHRVATDFCAENLVTVQPMVDMIMGDQTPVRLTSASAEPSPVEGLRVEKDNESLEVTWTVVELGRCPITYIVEHFVNKKLISSDTVTGFSTTLERIPCSSNEVRITSVARDSKGSSISEFLDVSLETLDSVANLNARVVEDELLLSWSPIVAGLCEISYRITNFNGETVNTYLTSETTVSVQKTTCAANKITVYGFEETTSIRSEDSVLVVDIDMDLTRVGDLIATRSSAFVLDITWSRPADAYNCDFSYLVSVRKENENIFEFKTEDNYASIELDLTPCSEFETLVTPISSEGVRGLPVGVLNIAHLLDVPPVQNIDSRIGLISWERPPNTGICELEYIINVRGSDSTETLSTTSTEISLDMIPCAEYNVGIQARDAFGHTSEEVVYSKIGNPRFLREISGLKYDMNRETLSISWEPPNVGICSVLYKITHEVNGVFDEYTTDNVTASLETISCSENKVTVTPSLVEASDITGDTLEEKISVEIDVIKPARNLNVLDNARVVWEAPEHVGNCDLVYMVEIFDTPGSADSGTGSVFVEFTKDLATKFEFVPCAEYNVYVTPGYNGRFAETANVTVIAEEAVHSAPKHIKTVPSLARAIITLSVDDLSKNSCPIGGARIICRGSNDELVDSTFGFSNHNTGGIFDIIFSNLVHNTHFTCKAQWLQSDSEFSETFEFLTMDIPTKQLEVSNVTSNEVTVSWEVAGGLGRYILHFTVVITTIGPNHFVQESCDIERNYTRYIEVPANVFSYTFTEALPNYKYHFSLITTYNIGVDGIADLAVVDTLPGVPGPITDLAASFSIEQCSKYFGDGVFTWSPPCDINGELSEFKVTLSTEYRVGGEDFVHTVNATILPADDDEDYNYSLKIPTLNPFFVYSIAVATIAAYPGEEPAALLDVVPPLAYSSCSA